jgi:hypothetical protein
MPGRRIRFLTLPDHHLMTVYRQPEIERERLHLIFDQCRTAHYNKAFLLLRNSITFDGKGHVTILHLSEMMARK